eukprot:8509594-Pyramimonas_sp.AAC.1
MLHYTVSATAPPPGSRPLMIVSTVSVSSPSARETFSLRERWRIQSAYSNRAGQSREENGYIPTVRANR